MLKDTTVRARVSRKLKHDSESILEKLGMSMSEAITLFLSQVRLRKGLPSDVMIPNRKSVYVKLSIIVKQQIERITAGIIRAKTSANRSVFLVPSAEDGIRVKNHMRYTIPTAGRQNISEGMNNA